jgi:integrase/recombinase XerD
MDSISGPLGVRFSGPLAPLAAGLAAELAALGYSPATVEYHLRLAAHLSRWLQTRGLGTSALTGPVQAEFLVERRREYSHLYSMQALGPTLGYLRRMGAAPAAETTVQSGPVEELLARFRHYLLVERAITVPVADAYLRWVRPFAQKVPTEDSGLVFARVDAAMVSGFLAGHLPKLGRKTAQMTASALRSLLRFLHAEGTLPVDVAMVVPAFAYRRQSGLPQPLTAAQVQALIDACDPSRPVGRRDLAVIACLLRLGLRCGEVATLRLEDINWVDGTVRVHGKGNRIDLLPLPTDVGAALVAYLRQGRPWASSRVVFLTAVAQFVLAEAAQDRLGPHDDHRRMPDDLARRPDRMLQLVASHRPTTASTFARSDCGNNPPNGDTSRICTESVSRPVITRRSPGTSRCSTNTSHRPRFDT